MASSTRPRTASRSCSGRRALSPATTSPCASRTPPPSSRSCWGAHYAGLLYTPCSTQLTAAELAYIADDCGASTFFLSARYGEKGPELRAGATRVRNWLSVGGQLDGFTAYEDQAAAMRPTPTESDRVAGRDMLYSSGTTGKPKGIRPTVPAAPLGETPGIVTGILQGMFGQGAD